MKVDFHTHTYHSYDSWMKPREILRIAKKRGLNGIVICDHDTIAGGVETKKLNDDPDFQVIVGAEIKTDAGDITGIFLTEEIQSRKASEVCREIKAQGGMTILNHPYEAHDLEKIDFSLIDFIEGYNARLSPKKNQKAIELAQKYNKRIIGGSDAHLYNEIANTYTIIDDFQSMIPTECVVKYSKIYNQTLSQYIKAIKYKNPRIAFGATIYLLKRILRYG